MGKEVHKKIATQSLTQKSEAHMKCYKGNFKKSRHNSKEEEEKHLLQTRL